MTPFAAVRFFLIESTGAGPPGLAAVSSYIAYARVDENRFYVQDLPVAHI
jgi:hypothetical protein